MNLECLYPVTAWRDINGQRPNGRWPLVFNPENGSPHEKLKMRCGQCIKCRLEKARQWSIRIVHESKMHEQNSFITLTYDDDHLPPNKSLNKKDYALFLKKLRQHIFRSHNQQIKFYQCAEYGDETARPHHHMCIFGYDFPERILYKTVTGIPLFISETLNKMWGHGFCTIGEITPDSAMYCAKYVIKKITGENAAKHYNGRMPEYQTMSLAEGIGKKFLDTYQSDIYNHDTLIFNGRKLRPTKYYDYLLEKQNPDIFRHIKSSRKEKLTIKNIKNPKPKKTLKSLKQTEKFIKHYLKTKPKSQIL